MEINEKRCAKCDGKLRLKKKKELGRVNWIVFATCPKNKTAYGLFCFKPISTNSGAFNKKYCEEFSSYASEMFDLNVKCFFPEQGDIFF